VTQINELKRRLIEAAVVCEMEGLCDAFGHISVRVPETDHILMTPQGPPGRAKPSDVIELNIQGEKLKGRGNPNTELPIHTSIYRVRSDVQSIVHAHPPKAIAFSVAGREIYPMRYSDGRLFPSVKIFGDPGTEVYIDSEALGQRMAQALGQGFALMIRGHGIVTVGGSIESACLNAITLERSAEIQFMASMLLLSQHMENFQTAALAKPRGPEVRARLDKRNWDFFHQKLKGYLKGRP